MAVLIVELKADLHANEYITSLMPVNLLSAVMDQSNDLRKNVTTLITNTETAVISFAKQNQDGIARLMANLVINQYAGTASQKMVKSAMDKKMMNTFNAQATAKLNSYVELLFLQRNDAIIDFKKMMRKNP